MNPRTYRYSERMRGSRDQRDRIGGGAPMRSHRSRQITPWLFGFLRSYAAIVYMAFVFVLLLLYIYFHNQEEK